MDKRNGLATENHLFTVGLLLKSCVFENRIKFSQRNMTLLRQG